MPLYSHSRLNTFENCRLSYKYKYIDNIKGERDGVEAFFGKRFHDTMEKLYNDLKFKVATLEELKGYYNEIWEKKWNDGVLIVRKDKSEDDYRKIGLKALEKYYKRYHPFEEGRILDVEKHLIMDLDGSGKYKVQGYIDRLMETENGHYEIHDYKTSNSMKSQEELDKDKQLALYSLAIRELYSEVNDVHLIWHFLEHNKKMISKRTTEQLQQLKQEILNLIKKIELETEFPANLGILCNWCEFQTYCPYYEK